MLQFNMAYKYFILIFFSLFFQACAINDKQQGNLFDSGQSFLNSFNKKSLTDKDIAAGLKEALSVGAERVVTRVGTKDGYLKDKFIHIALPEQLQEIHKSLNKLGLGRYTKELEIKMNRSAEVAAPKAKTLFFSAIKDMHWQDVKAIYKGKNDAATQYFKRKMTPTLKKMMRPVVSKVLSDVGAVKAYKDVAKQYNSIPFVEKINYDIEGYVINKAISGMFYYLEKEEAAIRKDPVKRTTALLKRVFGG